MPGAAPKKRHSDASDLTLPGQKSTPIGFLMGPYAETADGSPDPLEPSLFACTIAAKAIA